MNPVVWLERLQNTNRSVFSRCVLNRSYLPGSLSMSGYSLLETLINESVLDPSKCDFHKLGKSATHTTHCVPIQITQLQLSKHQLHIKILYLFLKCYNKNTWNFPIITGQCCYITRKIYPKTTTKKLHRKKKTNNKQNTHPLQ
jgi:hypothetical protein